MSLANYLNCPRFKCRASDGCRKTLTHPLPGVYTGADVTEPNSSDSRGERLDFFLKQEEALTAEPSYLGSNESEEAGGGAGGGTISSVANLKAALMSKNSLLSLRAEMMGDDNPLLYEYLPKGGHSLSCKSLFTNRGLTLLVTHTPSQPHVSLQLPTEVYTNCFDSSSSISEYLIMWSHVGHKAHGLNYF